MVCWLSFIFLVVTSEIFYIKACYCLHHWGTCSTFSFFFSCFQDFFTSHFFVPVCFFSCNFFFFFYVLWDLFTDKIFFVTCFCFVTRFLWVLTSNFTLVFMMHWCYPWHFVFEAILAFVLAIKLLQHLPLQHGHINHSYHEVVLALVLAMKQY